MVSIVSSLKILGLIKILNIDIEINYFEFDSLECLFLEEKFV